MLGELVERGIRADRVYGASVGAVNGAAYAGDPTAAGVRRLEAIWRALRAQDVFPRTRMHGPWTYVLQRPAVHSDRGLRRIVSQGLTFERLEDAQIPFEVVATSLVDGRERWFSRGPAAPAVMASAAIPAIFPPVTIDGDTLVDGGIVNNVPISRAMEQGARRIYVLLCGPPHFRPRMPRRPLEAVVTSLFVAVHARFTRELTTVPRGLELIVFTGAEGGEVNNDFAATAELIDAGRAEVASVLDAPLRTPVEGPAGAAFPEAAYSEAAPEPALGQLPEAGLT
jgi:NTE family protein